MERGTEEPSGSGDKVVDREAVQVPKRGKLKKIPLLAAPAGPDGESEEDKVLRLLYDELVLMGAPIVDSITSTTNPERTRQALLGKFRASSVKRYLAYWQGFRKWVVATYGKLPSQGEQLVDYLLAREEEGMGASVPLSVGKGVSWFEKLAGFEDWQWLSSSPLVDVVVRDLLKKLEDGAPPRRRALRILSTFVPALERLVLDQQKEDRLRAGAFVKLLKVWASLRFDDAAHMRVDMVRCYDKKMSGLLRRTKTTGGGKRVKELPFHVSECAWIDDDDWLQVGVEVLGSAVGKSCSFLIPAGVSQGLGVGDYVMAYQEAVSWSTEVMQELKDKSGAPLIPHRFWTEHSERATLPSGLAALGIPKSDRDLLGRWTPEGSDQYVRTYNAVVSRMQASR